MPKRNTTFATVVAAAALVFAGVGPAQAGAGEKPSPAPATPVVQISAPDQGARPRVAPSAATTAALAALQTGVADYVAWGTSYTFGDYIDPDTGKIVLETDAPAGVVSSLLDLTGAPADQQQAADQAQVRHTTITAGFNRRDDVPPFWGAAGIANGGFVCSSGYAVRNPAGTVSMTTAGHCFANGATVLTESGARTVGTVSNRHLSPITGDKKDMELIGGQSYAGRIYTGGITSTTSIPVVSAGPAVVGFNNYCDSGRTTGENCGHTALSVTAQVCYTVPPLPNACIDNAIAFTGGTLPGHGDSGGPFYAKDNRGAFIRGNFVAFNSTTAWAEPWTVVASTLGVSIVTG